MSSRSMPENTHRNRARVLVAALVGAALIAPAPLASSAAEPAAPPRLSVDLAASEGPVMRGANGSLYGISDDGVPSDAMLAPLKLTTASQKPQGGAQHPNGDAITASKSFFRNGGGDVLVMMQDVYAKWPYEQLGLPDYLTKVDRIVADVKAAEKSERFVYVPFNEPDWIWYGLNAQDTAKYEEGRDRFFADWKTVYQAIRAKDPKARIAGPNEAYYDKRFLPEFFAFAQKNDVLPDITTWHELSPDSLKDFQDHIEHYRALEKSLGITPRPVNINEYANRRDLSVPGQLVQWVSLFERNKVFADQAYWDAAGNLDGNVVHTNIPNGGWWFFRWYAGLSGNTVRVTPPKANAVDTLQGLASYDRSRKQAQVLLGGAAGDADVAVRKVDPKVFGREVTATVTETAWSGYEGAHAAPQVVQRTTLKVAADGTVSVPLRGLRKMSAYRIVLTPAVGKPAAVDVPWSASYEAEDAKLTDGGAFTQGTLENANGYAASGTKDVGALKLPTSKAEFAVQVPRTGTYDLSILYGNQSGTPSSHRLSVDGGAPVKVAYPSTQNWTHRGRKELTVHLTAGAHTLTLARDTGEATLDRIDLTAHRTPSTSYEAVLADLSGDPAFRYRKASELLLDRGDSAVFDVYAPRDGYYDVTPRADDPVRLALQGETLTAEPDEPRRLYLVAGNNRITATGRDVALRSLEVTGEGSTTGTLDLPAAKARLAGGARLLDSPYAPSGSYIGWLGNNPDSTATFTAEAPRAGRYLLVVHYANNDRRDNGHSYNTDIMSRTADITVAGVTRKVTFKNTWSWDDYWTIGVPVDLRKGENTLTLTNPTGWAPNIDRVSLALVKN